MIRAAHPDDGPVAAWVQKWSEEWLRAQCIPALQAEIARIVATPQPSKLDESRMDLIYFVLTHHDD